MSRIFVACMSSSWPESGGSGQRVHTDIQGQFEFFVAPGLACVYLADSSPFLEGPHVKMLKVAGDRDPDLLVLKANAGAGRRSQMNLGLPIPVRVTAELGNELPRIGTRSLVGRISDQSGSAISGVQVNFHDGKSAFTSTSRNRSIGRVPAGGTAAGEDLGCTGEARLLACFGDHITRGARSGSDDFKPP